MKSQETNGGALNKSKQGHLGRLKEKKSKAADMYIRKLKANAKLRLVGKWRKKWKKLVGKAWDFEGKWRNT
jgi:hypothetical protein